MCEIYFIASQQGLFLLRPGSQEILLSSHVQCLRIDRDLIVSLSISSHSAKYFLPAISEGAAAAESAGVRLIIEFVAA